MSHSPDDEPNNKTRKKERKKERKLLLLLLLIWSLLSSSFLIHSYSLGYLFVLFLLFFILPCSLVSFRFFFFSFLKNKIRKILFFLFHRTCLFIPHSKLLRCCIEEEEKWLHYITTLNSSSKRAIVKVS